MVRGGNDGTKANYAITELSMPLVEMAYTCGTRSLTVVYPCSLYVKPQQISTCSIQIRSHPSKPRANTHQLYPRYTYAHSTPPSLAHDSQPHNLGPSSNSIMHSMQYQTEPIDSLSLCTCIPCNHHAVLSCTSPWGDELVAGWWWSGARYG
jgi:hypothetical protein